MRCLSLRRLPSLRVCVPGRYLPRNPLPALALPTYLALPFLGSASL